MYYISSKNMNRYGITDTNDGVEEFFTMSELINIANKVKVEGLLVMNGQIRMATPTTPDLIKLESCKIGTPFRIKLSRNSDWKQCIYIGCNYDNESKVTFKIADSNSGKNNYFLLTNGYVIRHKKDCKFDFCFFDQVEVNIILKNIGRN